MLTKEQNARLTSVEGDAPMARLMRENYWIPFSRIGALEAGAPPTRVKLMGERYAAWRTPDGRVGFVDERCPHRGASMVLARVEGCNLRCIFHGWVVDPSGAVIEVPTEGERSAQVAPHVPVNRYPTAEKGGLVWVWLGGGEPPEFPDFAWLDLPQEHLWITRSLWPVNWLQGLEAALDTAHVGYLHSSWARPDAELDDQSRRFKVNPRFEVHDTAYGMRSAGVRACDDGLALVRVSEFLAPFIAMTPGSLNGEKGEASLYLFVPVDDHSHLQFFGFFSQHAPLGSFYLRDICTDPENYVDVQGSEDDNWRQDRGAMNQGHFSGYVGHVLLEDAVVQASIGPVADRTRDFLTHIDLGIQRCRQLLLDQLDRFEAGTPIDGAMPAVNREVIARGGLIPVGSDWRTIA
jgi:nitrite reductase/ring-hydroxylating ferredoxin subunit